MQLDITRLAGILVWTQADRFEAMARFYRDTLGLEPRSERRGFINFEWGDVRLTIATHDDVVGTTSEPERMMVNLDVRDIGAVHTRLQDAGVVFSREPSEERWGWVATMSDPDGNTIQLIQPNE